MGKSSKIKAAARLMESEQLIADSLLDEQSAWWSVHSSGYVWQDSPDGRILSEREGRTVDCMSEYNPLEVGGLFRQFAQVPLTEDGCRRFANKYGVLRTSGLQGEVFGEWCEAIETMHLAVTVWDQIEAGTISERLPKPPPVAYQPALVSLKTAEYVRLLHTPTFLRDHYKSLVKEVGPVSAGMEIVQLAINLGLHAETSLRIALHSKRGKYVLRVTPRTLLGCMWWQFARLFLGQVEYGECRVCGKPIERGEGAFMVTREFCSPACKQKDHRARVKQAKGLKAKGLSVAKIAKKLETEPEVINRWLTKKK